LHSGEADRKREGEGQRGKRSEREREGVYTHAFLSVKSKNVLSKLVRLWEKDKNI